MKLKLLVTYASLAMTCVSTTMEAQHIEIPGITPHYEVVSDENTLITKAYLSSDFEIPSREIPMLTTQYMET